MVRMNRLLAIFANNDGVSPILKFLDGLSVKEQAKCTAYLTLLEQEGNQLTSQFIKHIEGDLWELRPEFGGVEMRLFYFAWVDDMLVIVHAMKKKSQKTKPRDMKLAQRRVQEVKDGKAYLIQIFP
jgi:phage-related protein